MRNLFPTVTSFVTFLGWVSVAICFTLAYILTCTTLAGISQ